ncbi:MAG TPA: hypothetical protein H9902_00370 [Candidatus Stackebrandtia faecavium]|nr:hypothetical protein [Candidatus Stackebrandtia faecavium]
MITQEASAPAVKSHAHMDDVMQTLYPRGGRARGRRVQHIAVPNRATPRVLVPADSRKLAISALLRYARPASFLSRTKRAAAVAAFATGTDAVFLPDRIVTPVDGTDIESHLRSTLGTNIYIGIAIGPARTNRKPVLQVLNSTADTIAFAKLGANWLTHELVANEIAALRELAPTSLLHVQFPRILHAGAWNGHNLLVQEALPGWRRPQRLDYVRLATAMNELATCRGTKIAAVGESPYAAQLHGKLALLHDRTNAGSVTLTEAARKLLELHSHHLVQFGAWHGDWSPWNMSMQEDTVLLWDFERFASNVPVGFDALHYALQDDVVTHGTGADTAVATLLDEAPHILDPFNVPYDIARTIASFYLVDLAIRYLSDRAVGGTGLDAASRTLLPALLHHISREAYAPTEEAADNV